MLALFRAKTFIILCVFLSEIIYAFRGSYRIPKIAKLHPKLLATNNQIEVTTRDFDITPAINARVQDKVGTVLSKLSHDIVSTHVVLKIVKQQITTHFHSVKPGCNIAEATIIFKGGAVAHVKEQTDDMYASIDLVAHKIAQSIKKHNSKVIKSHHKGPSKEDLYSPDETLEIVKAEFNEAALLVELDKKYKDLAKPSATFDVVPHQVVKPKSFQMPPITVDEAALALDYIEHPFYVFRNKETNEINVIYRRNSGGLGLIKPE